MSSRPPAQPPALPGFEFVRHLGSGGFADVYLYEEQNLGRRNVAVKVLLKGELVAGALENFSNEATLMARLSNHPSIVSVHQAGISVDGRPFIVMEYCSKPTLHARYRAARFSEAETLRIGIQIAGAVETAHRAGILHRDIKPANILVTDYGRPALTDFGIAATTASGAAAGLSVPWAPPEAVESGRMGDARSDVYSLAATLYTVLAGRTPFEIPGASNTTVDLMGRIQTAPLPRIGRADVLASVEKVLATALSRDPESRYPSAMAFARALQRLQIERGMQPTTVDVMDDAIDTGELLEDEGRTVVRSVVTIEAQAPTPKIVAPAPVFETAGRTMLRPEIDDVAATQLRGAAGIQIDPTSTPDPATGSTDGLVPTKPDRGEHGRPRARRPMVVGVAVAVLAAAGLGVAGFMLAPQPAAPRTPTASAQPIDPVPAGGRPPKVTDLKGKELSSGKVTFSWKNPEPKTGDRYHWRLLEIGVTHTYAVTDKASVTVPATKSGTTCIEVQLVRSDGGTALQPAQGCAK